MWIFKDNPFFYKQIPSNKDDKVCILDPTGQSNPNIMWKSNQAVKDKSQVAYVEEGCS